MDKEIAMKEYEEHTLRCYACGQPILQCRCGRQKKLGKMIGDGEMTFRARSHIVRT